MTAAVSLAKKKRLGEGSKYSRSDILKLKEMFDSHDLDNDGRVTASELLSALREGPLRQSALSTFRSVDMDKNCVLTFSEYLRRIYPYANDREVKVMLAWVKRIPTEPQEAMFKPTVQQLEEISKMFDRFDSNRDGVIEVQELIAISASYGYDESEVEELFRNADKDMDGTISFTEFIDLMKLSYV
ncbi:hypothetical protein Vretimale_3767 [Volvox reticuliferus]|uniref:EF-hand domain-containing protein n=1 Tax=Volvox reticuliferus TaxID=1737510 RepID=A0A8J4BWN1_9CHLO|nr:hypothetical protein Vretifemale_1395 [Volvox reticuliferus]GIL98395.1 hypothetical protein Vretimale_3767 [Volvox reticuliferus]